jgi:hypothetical protein
MRTKSQRYGAIASGVSIIVFGIFLLVLGLTDFNDPQTSGLLPAALAFVLGATLASSCYWNMAGRVRAQWVPDSRL